MIVEEADIDFSTVEKNNDHKNNSQDDETDSSPEVSSEANINNEGDKKNLQKENERVLRKKTKTNYDDSLDNTINNSYSGDPLKDDITERILMDSSLSNQISAKTSQHQNSTSKEKIRAG